jgi:hypothetical protein
MGNPESEPYAATRARCEAAVRRNGHPVTVWYPVDERLHALLCEGCGAMAWMSLSGGEERWRIGGPALDKACQDRVERSETGS